MTDKASIAPQGWYVIVEMQRGDDPHQTLVQFWMAGYADPSEAVSAVEAAASVLPNAHTFARQEIAPIVLQAIALRINEVRLYAP